MNDVVIVSLHVLLAVGSVYGEDHVEVFHESIGKHPCLPGIYIFLVIQPEKDLAD